MSAVTSSGSGSGRGGAAEEAERLERQPAFRWLVRTGFVARALTYAVMGGLAVALAVGAGTDGVAPDQEGALSLISQNVIGKVALVAIAVGLLAYAVWKLTQGIVGRGPEGGGGPTLFDRVSNLGGGVVYLGFFFVAVRSLIESGESSSSQTHQTAAGVLAWPGGPVLVAIAGVVLLAISAYQVYDALSGHFTEQAKTRRMNAAERRTFKLLGMVGITARALAFAPIGYFLLKTAITYNPQNAVGVDGALAQLHHHALGSAIVGLVAAGFLVFAAYSVLEGRYRRL